MAGGNRWTKREDKKLEKMRLAGMTCKEIAVVLGRTVYSVEGASKRLKVKALKRGRPGGRESESHNAGKPHGWNMRPGPDRERYQAKFAILDHLDQALNKVSDARK